MYARQWPFNHQTLEFQSHTNAESYKLNPADWAAKLFASARKTSHVDVRHVRAKYFMRFSHRSIVCWKPVTLFVRLTRYLHRHVNICYGHVSEIM